MGVATGNSGVIKIGADTIAQVSSWTLESSAEPAEHSVIGNAWRNYKASIKGYNISLEGYYDIADTAAEALDVGAEVTFELYPAGETSGEKQYDGTAIVSTRGEGGTFDGMVTFTANLQGNGALVETTVTP